MWIIKTLVECQYVKYSVVRSDRSWKERIQKTDWKFITGKSNQTSTVFKELRDNIVVSESRMPVGSASNCLENWIGIESQV